MRRAIGAALALFSAGCSHIRNIPAESTPVREARYYRTRDEANFALGAACDAAVGLVIHGPDLNHDRQNWAPLIRMSICTTGALVQRQVDKGYRESGGIFIISGALVTEMFRILLKAVDRIP